MPERSVGRLMLVMLLAAALGVPPPSSAPAAWSEPQTVSGPGASPILSLGFDGRGRGLLAWSSQGRRNYTSTLPPGGPWSAPRSLPRGISYTAAEVQPYGRANALLVARQRQGSDAGVTYRIIASAGTSAGAFNRLETLDTGPGKGRSAARSVTLPVLAVNRRGDALAAWVTGSRGVAVLRTAERRAGRSFSRARTRSGHLVPFRSEPYFGNSHESAAVALDAEGNRVVAWYRNRHIEARIRRAGHAWGAVRRIGYAPHQPRTMSASAGGEGRFLVGWGTLAQPQGEPGVNRLNAAVRSGGKWVERRLERFETRPAFQGTAGRRVLTVFDSAGEGFAAWTGPVSDRAAVKVAALQRDRFGSAQVLSGDRFATLADLAAGPAGRVAVSWVQQTGEVPWRRVPYVSLRAPATGFLPAERVGTPRCAGPLLCDGSDGRVAFSPLTGEPVIAWLEAAGSTVQASVHR